MRLTNRLTATVAAVALGASLMAAPIAARADEKGDRTAAYALGGLAAGLLLTQRDKTAGAIAAAGAAYEAYKVNQDIKNRHKWEDRYGYNRYRNNHNNGNYNDRYNRNRYDSGYNNDRYNRDNYDSGYSSDRYDNYNSGNHDSGYSSDRYDRYYGGNSRYDRGDYGRSHRR